MPKLLPINLLGLGIIFLSACGSGGSANPPGNSGSALTLTVLYDYFGEISIVKKNTIDEAGHITRMTVSYEPGNDLTWFTSDDVISYNLSFEYDSQGREIKMTSLVPGADALAFTDDDVTVFYQLYSYSNDGSYSRRRAYQDPGSDGVWFTGDDTAFPSYVYYKYYPNGKLRGQINYYDAGIDGVWYTSDDLFEINYNTYEYDGSGNQTRRITYSDPGPDRMAYTNDDVILDYDQNKFDSNNILVEGSYCYEAGLDGKWFTADDTCDGVRAVSKYDKNGYPSRILVGYAGADNTWNTSDDYISSYEDVVYDASGYIVSKTIYNQPGNDYVWFTGDDVLSANYEYTLY